MRSSLTKSSFAGTAGAAASSRPWEVPALDERLLARGVPRVTEFLNLVIKDGVTDAVDGVRGGCLLNDSFSLFSLVGVCWVSSSADSGETVETGSATTGAGLPAGLLLRERNHCITLFALTVLALVALAAPSSAALDGSGRRVGAFETGGGTAVAGGGC